MTARTFYEGLFDALGPDFTGTILEHLSVFALRGKSVLSRGRG